MNMDKYFIDRKNSVLLVIDIQERFVPHLYEKETVIKNAGILIDAAKRLNIPILVTEQYPQGLGRTVEILKNKLGDVNIVEKDTFSCFGEVKFREALKKIGRSHIVITGIETHVCVQQTVLDLLRDNFSVVVVKDAVSSRFENNKKPAVKLMREAGAVVTTTESVLFQWLERSGTPEFKDVQKLIK